MVRATDCGIYLVVSLCFSINAQLLRRILRRIVPPFMNIEVVRLSFIRSMQADLTLRCHRFRFHAVQVFRPDSGLERPYQFARAPIRGPSNVHDRQLKQFADIGLVSISGTS